MKHLEIITNYLKEHTMALIDFLPRTQRALAHPFSARIDLARRLAIWRSRRDLARLDARALDDIGVSRKAAEKEASRTLWDVPATWTDR
jgi:uncharacterized protein YjiS (DUF1127 family)